MAAVPDFLIGIHLTAGCQDIGGTLQTLYRTVDSSFALVVLVDPAPGETAGIDSQLAALPGVARLAVAEPGGGPASFNRLIACEAERYLFLEAGARPGPGWLHPLSTALDASPAHGLAGPSTNRGWNEQSIAACGPSSDEITHHARALASRHGAEWRPMAPLHSLSDFCLLLRREVAAAVGAADLAYGRGPCWEMDYTARAARAGFASVWAPAAFVYRPAPPACRLAAETRLLEVNKRIYQDRLCGRRAREGAASTYRPHCRGDACPDFAPPATTRIHLPLPTPAVAPNPAAADLPLITCAMPTRGRPGFVARSIAYFRRQDYPNRELLIVYEHETDLPPDTSGPDIRLVRTTETSIGAKRQRAASEARGALIAHWDDDDWYGPQRLSRQAAPILQGLADITGLNDLLFLLVPTQEFWTVTPDLFARLFVENVAGGTLVFHRSAWQRSGPYPSTSLCEDCDFMRKAIGDGARLCALPGRDLCIYIRHQNNTWKFAEGRYMQASGWSPAREPTILAPDRAFYFPEPQPAPAPPPRPTIAHRIQPTPLVSCIMPTANRRAFVAQALASFSRQNYTNRELIVVDDGEDAVADLIPSGDATIRYLRLDRRVPLGAKRNIACELARGEVIAHWDDDDWMAPGWLASQVETLSASAADLCGLNKVLFYAPETREGWRYTYDGPDPWVYGGTLCYTKAFWSRSPFSRVDVGEDNAFVWSSQPKRLSVNAREEFYVGTIHRQNSSPKRTSGQRWCALPAPRVEALIRTMELTHGP